MSLDDLQKLGAIFGPTTAVLMFLAWPLLRPGPKADPAADLMKELQDIKERQSAENHEIRERLIRLETIISERHSR